MQTGTPTTLEPQHFWRQAVCLSISWVWMLIALIALPGLRLISVLLFVGLFVALGIRWSLDAHQCRLRAARAEATVPARAARRRGGASA